MSESSESLDVLIERVRRRDRNALVEFVERRRPQLQAFVKRSLSDAMRRKVEAADILQETTLSALEALDSVDLADRDPFNWLCHLAEQRIIDAHRRFFGAQKRAAGREVGLGSPGTESGRGGFIDLLVASITSPSRAFSRRQKEFQLLEALETLPPECRDAIRLRYVDGLPTKDIAARLGKSDGAVRVMLSRSLSRLQTMLRDTESRSSGR